MPEIIMTCGTICCGKSTYAKKIQTERNINAVFGAIGDALAKGETKKVETAVKTEAAKVEKKVAEKKLSSV